MQGVDDVTAPAPDAPVAPRAGEDRRLRVLLWVAVALVGAGLWAFVLRGADGPADPTLGDPPVDLDAPGDPDRVPLHGFSEVAISVDPGDGSGLLRWCLLLASTREQRARGLMGVTEDDLGSYPGMAFAYRDPVANGFYMKDTVMPLSIAWIDEEGAVVSTADMEPCPTQEGCPTYQPGGRYVLAIEVPQGRLADLGIVPGSTTEVTGSCAPAADGADPPA